MKKLTPKSLFCVALVSFSSGTYLKAQQNLVLPSNASSSLSPMVPPSDTPPVFPEGATTVQSLPLTYVPSGRVTANEYYRMLQTTGSYVVNRERSQADQTAAISKAREMRRLKEQMALTRHYRSNFESASDLLETIPPPSPPEPVDEDSSESENSGTPGAGSPTANAATSDVPQFTPADQVRVPLLQKLINKRRQSEAVPEPAAELENPYPDDGAIPPAPPRQGPDEINAPTPPPGTPAPQFAGLEDAPPEPAPRKGFFSRFRKNPEPTNSPEPIAEQPQAAPETSIFRPSSLATKSNRTYSITGRKVFADVAGTQIKLSQGTKVTLLRSGTSRSLIQLYDNRQGTVPNEFLVPDS